MGPGIGRVGPEGLRDQGAGEGTVAEREEGEQALRCAGDWRQKALAEQEAEAIEQAN
ncbi:MAG TPA: hypothetical protein PKD75_10880 [Tepidiformaceae bacterium]|nr:hypothetical protein [Tepidiformaceae bacterium]